MEITELVTGRDVNHGDAQIFCHDR